MAATETRVPMGYRIPHDEVFLNGIVIAHRVDVEVEVLHFRGAAIRNLHRMEDPEHDPPGFRTFLPCVVVLGATPEPRRCISDDFTVENEIVVSEGNVVAATANDRTGAGLLRETDAEEGEQDERRITQVSIHLGRVHPSSLERLSAA